MDLQSGSLPHVARRSTPHAPRVMTIPRYALDMSEGRRPLRNAAASRRAPAASGIGPTPRSSLRSAGIYRQVDGDRQCPAVAPIQFYRFRRKAGDDGGRRPAGGFRIRFAQPVRRSLCLGHSTHFGLGLFLPEAGSPPSP